MSNPTPKPKVSQKEKTQDITDNVDLDPKISIWREEIINNAAYAYPDLVNRAVSLNKLSGQQPLRPNDIFNVVISYINEDAEKPGDPNQYIASLVTGDLAGPVLMHTANSSGSFERALKMLFIQVSMDASSRMRSLKRHSDVKQT